MRGRQQIFAVIFFAALALWMSACVGATRQPDAAGPRANEPPYPVLLASSEDRSTAALAAWSALTKAQGIANAPAPELDPVTSTIRSLPTLPSGTALYLPKVGAQLPATEEETRESLRRFIVNESRLTGAQPQQLSLITRAEAPAGAQTARYEQRPFRYPLRGGYGALQIDFAPDGRLLQFSSTCIPEAESLQRAATGIRPRYSAEEVAKRLVNRSFDVTQVTNASGNTNQTAQPQFTVMTGDQINIGQLVIYPRPRLTIPVALEFHLAWEIGITRASQKYTVYLDAVTDEFISAMPVS